MAILVDENTAVIIQGITGSQGVWTTRLMLDAGTRVVAGVTPGKAGQDVHGVPVYDSIAEAVAAHPESNAAFCLVPARLTREAVYEAVDGGLKLVVAGAEGVPVADSMEFITYARAHGTRVIGPDALGVFSPGKAKIGSHFDFFFKPGRIGLVGKGGTSSYEIAGQICSRGLGISTVINLGGARVTGTGFPEVLALFEADPATDAVVLVGEIGGDAEEQAAKFIAQHMSKPVVAIILGRTAPPGKQMGHAGAIIERGEGGGEGKERAFREAGVQVAHRPAELAALLQQSLSDITLT